MTDGKIEIKDVDTTVEHVLAEKNGTVTVTIQDGVILEIKHESTKRRKREK